MPVEVGSPDTLASPARPAAQRHRWPAAAAATTAGAQPCRSRRRRGPVSGLPGRAS